MNERMLQRTLEVPDPLLLLQITQEGEEADQRPFCVWQGRKWLARCQTSLNDIDVSSLAKEKTKNIWLKVLKGAMR